MADSARVTSIDALKRFREALVKFAEEAKHSLVSTDLQNRRISDWVNTTQKMYWLNEVKRRREKLGELRSELHRRKISGASDTEQMEAVRRETARLRHAEEKVEVVKRWGPPLLHAIDEYHGTARGLDDMLGREVAEGIAALDRMITALEEYIQLSPPSG